MQHGLCSTQVNIQSSILDPILEQLPGAVIDGINNGIPTGLAQGMPQIRALGMASFLVRQDAVTLGGGFDQYLAVHVPFQFPPLVNDAAITRNYSYFFTLNDGILATTAGQNHQADCDTGFFSGTIASGLDGSGSSPGVAQQVANGIYLAARGNQAAPVTAASTDPQCTNMDTATRPGFCFQACENLPDDPNTWPPPLDTSHTDDSAWYATTFCQRAAAFIGLGVGAGAVAQAANEIDPAMQSLLTQTTTQNQLENLIVGPKNGDATKFASVRCNFHPDYVTPDPTQFGGKPQPVCELIVRAKRMNVFPDAVELVWYDGAASNNTPASELSVEGFSVFLLTRGAGLCTRQPYVFANGTGRRFAHVSFY